MTIKKFRINIEEQKISKIYQKVAEYDWSIVANLEDWKHGTNKNYLKELCSYWVEKYDWRKYEKVLNNFSNFKTKVDDINIHFIKEIGSGSNPNTLLLMHGWPGSVFEFYKIIDQLAHPEKYGGLKEDQTKCAIRNLLYVSKYCTYWKIPTLYCSFYH